MQVRNKQLAILAAQQAAERLGYILIPGKCLSWRKRKALGDARRIRINESYYALKLSEITRTEKNKFDDFIKEMGEENDFNNE